MKNNNDYFFKITRQLYIILACVFIAILTWVYLSPLSSAVIATGTITTITPPQEIRSPYSGKIKSINIENDRFFKKGDVLLSIDSYDIEIEKNKTIIDFQNELVKYINIKKLLNIEILPEESEQLSSIDPLVLQSIYNRYFSIYLSNKDKKDFDEKNRYTNSINLNNRNIAILENKLELLKTELKLIEDKQVAYNSLFNQELTSLSTLDDLQKEVISIKKQIVNTLADINNSALNIESVSTAYNNYQNNQKSEILNDLVVSKSILDELRHNLEKIEFDIENSSILAPMDGFIVNTSKIAKDSYISSQQILFEIIPDTQLIAKVYLSNTDIENIIIDQEVDIIMSAYNLRTTESIKGVITKIGTTSEVINESLTAYPIEIHFEKPNNTIQFKTGMPVQATILKDERTVFEYLFSTIIFSLNKSLRE